MQISGGSNERTPSTTYEWRKVKISERPAGPRAQSAEGRRRKPLAQRDRRAPLTITIQYRGGSEAWWELRARGKVLRRPGHFDLHSVLSEFDGEYRGRSRGE